MSGARRHWLAVVAILAASLRPAAAGEAVTPVMRAGIEGVITAQIDAFERDDGAAALAFAAPALQAMFGDGPHFLDMVRTGYPAVFRPRSFRFGELASSHGVLRQAVEVVGPDGARALALYDMEREANGSWRIAGCTLVKDGRIDL